MLALYHEHARHFSPKLLALRPQTQGMVQGRPALRDWWADAFRRLPSLHYQLDHLVADERAVFMEYTRQVENEPELRVGEVLELRNGLIIASRVYHG